MEEKMVSIIVVTYNSESYIESCLNSVVNQKDIYELIVIDGQSEDNTVEIIMKFTKYIKYFISEKDTGIYDAMNKGVEQTTSKWLFFLGSDDIMNEGILDKMSIWLKQTHYSIIFGNIQYNNNKIFYSNLSCKTYLQNTVHHQSAFYNKALFEKLRFDTDLSIISDYEINIYILVNKLSYKKVDEIISTCAIGGASFDFKKSLKETNILRSKYTRPLCNFFLKKILNFKYYLHYVLLRKI